jgi:hypothetical protein
MSVPEVALGRGGINSSKSDPGVYGSARVSGNGNETGTGTGTGTGIANGDAPSVRRRRQGARETQEVQDYDNMICRRNRDLDRDIDLDGDRDKKLGQDRRRLHTALAELPTSVIDLIVSYIPRSVLGFDVPSVQVTTDSTVMRARRAMREANRDLSYL